MTPAWVQYASWVRPRSEPGRCPGARRFTVSSFEEDAATALVTRRTAHVPEFNKEGFRRIVLVQMQLQRTAKSAVCTAERCADCSALG